MRVNKIRQERTVAMTKAQTEIWEVLLSAKLSDLEIVSMLSEMLNSLLGRIVRAEHAELAAYETDESDG